MPPNIAVREDNTMEKQRIDRRSALRLGICAGACLLPIGAGNALAAEKNESVSANEDLMREHGMLIRLLLVYGACAKKLKADPGAQVKALRPAAEIIQQFVEGYHEILEESYLFPRFDKGEMGDLVKLLKTQHEAGRKVTGRILELAKSGLGGDKSAEAVKLISSFKHMYYPHMAREDTVLFPAFHAALSDKEYKEMGEKFEKTENDIFGTGGFEKTLKKVEDLEKEMGVYDLAQYTPKI